MVVSKDNKRRRKETDTPPPAAAATASAAAAAAVESSPEMPKRTKVQAQRKFAQGQSAPSSSSSGIMAYSSVVAAAAGAGSGAGGAGTGPSTSGAESTQPPIEILPNKCPKPQDFLTFLCFRGTPALPAHLDYLNQGKSKDPKESDATTTTPAHNNNNNNSNSNSSKKAPNSRAVNNKKKRGRPAKGAAAATKKVEPEVEPEPQPQATTDKSSAAATAAADKAASDKPNLIPAAGAPTTATTTTSTTPLLPGAVRKRAEVVTDGNRRGARGRAAQENNSLAAATGDTTNKRRSNRSSTKESKAIIDDQADSDELEDGHDEEEDDDEYFSAHDATSRNGDEASKEGPTKAEPAKRGRPAAGAAKKPSSEPSSVAVAEIALREKGPVKRVRQRESPIFIPSPESSGRMTRQRAFFEPVKVPPQQEEPEKAKEDSKKKKEMDSEASKEAKEESEPEQEPAKQLKETKEKTNSSIYAKEAKQKQQQQQQQQLENGDSQHSSGNKGKKSLNVFDFSSDDEQPLAKSIKLKKGAKGASPKKGNAAAAPPATARSRKAATKKLDKEKEKEEEKEKEKEKDVVMAATNAATAEPSKRGAGKAGKKKAEDPPADEQDLAPPCPKKATTNARPGRKSAKSKAAVEEAAAVEVKPQPQRSQRPSRKTKEAAAIYMGIIGHKLQMADDDDDDLSLSSFPDIPNVKEMEKMEKEIKKNAAGKLNVPEATTVPTAGKQSRKPSPKPPQKGEAAGTAAGSAAAVSEVPRADPPSPPESEEEKPPPPARRGRPPKQGRAAAAAPAKPPIEGMLVKKGSLTKMSEQAKPKAKSEQSKVNSDEEEDFLINEELNETKRNLEKSFSDSDDEPLAIKVPCVPKGSSQEKDSPLPVAAKLSATTPHRPTAKLPAVPAASTATATTSAAVLPSVVVQSMQIQAPIIPPLTTQQLSMLPLTTKAATPMITPTLTALPLPSGIQVAAANCISIPPLNYTPLKAMEKKSPVPTSKILNVPATYALPGGSAAAAVAVGFQKTSSYLPQASPHYHSGYVRPPPTPSHPFGSGGGPSGSKTPAQGSSTSSPLKYQTPPTTYPPPIEAYQCPKINPNFLTPKYERSPLPPRSSASSNFPTPSPVKFLPTPTSTTVGTGTGTASSSATKSPLAPPTPATPPVVTSASQPVVLQTSSLSLSTATAPTPSPAPAPVASTSAAAAQQASGAAAGGGAPTSTPTPPPAHSNSNAGGSGDPLKDEIGSILAQATLMPSKEESGKIFGIASVSLAQSSGPDNTKCTLGKCGSIHKPVLGPVVPTEGYFGDQLTSKERRKAKVNMTHEQIQKWLMECSSNPDEILQDDLDDDFDDNMRVQQSTTPPPTRDEKELSASFSSSSKNTRGGDLGKSESAWSAKGPSLKATPVVVTPSSRKEQEQADCDVLDCEKSSTPVNLTQKSDAAADKAAAPDKKSVMERKTKESVRSRAPPLPRSAATTPSTPTPTPTPVTPTKSTPPTPPPPASSQQRGNKGKKNATAAAAAAAAAAVSPAPLPPPTPPTPKRTPVYNQKGNKAAAQQQAETKQPPPVAAPVTAKRGSESIYAFGKEEEIPAGTKPGNRRRVEPTPTPPPASPAPVPNALSERSPTKKRAAAAAAATAVQLTLSPTENCKIEGSKPKTGAGRAAKKQQQQQVAPPPPVAAVEPSGDSDPEGATFYIPLQGAGVGGGGDGGIQGVAVKLGREGPDGPNQKVVMQATLVTKAQMDTNSKPLPESMNTNELVKTLFHAASNNDAASTTSLKSLPKASTSAAAGGGGGVAGGVGASSLVRVNSNSSLFSGSAKSRTAAQTSSTAAAVAKKYKDDTPIKMANNTAFPRHDDPTQMVEAPIFRPTEKEFADPIEFIERITPIAARFGICKIIPPASFKPECRISDEMRFTAYNQYVHKMLHRWGPSAKELSAIKKYLATQSITMNHPPWIGGMEVDLPRLYHTVQELGGLKEVIEKKKWSRVAEEMCIPKLAQDRVTKLDDIYCKYLLPYDTLSPAERQKLFDEVEADWAKREARARRNADRFVNTESVSNEEDDLSSDEDEESEEEIDGVSMECIVKGRSMPLSQFYRIARNTMALWFKSTDPTVNEVEAEFWRHVAVRDSHVCVHSGSIDSSGWGYGFPSPGPKGKGSNYARHPWNLKVLTNNAGSVLRSLGPVMGVTVPTLHVGMLFSACCWYRDPHGLSWIEYLHTGASKLWYGIPDDQSANFRSALTSLIPTHCQNKTIWLPCDTVMVPPHMLTDRGVSLCRIEQKPGEFIVVFPRAYTSSLATGYVVSESVYFATMSWLDLAKDDFRDIHESCEPAMFSLEQLLFALGYDQRVNSDTLHQMLPMLNEVCEKESAAREQLRAAGVTSTEKVQAEKGQKAKKQQQPPHKSIESECDLCRANLYISMVRTEDGNVYCLQHALKNLNNGNIQAKQCKLIYAYNVDDIQQLIRQLQEKIHHKAAVKKK
ncbi:LOW QUALITY PROTEIN: serine/arginine repetitive matrix protein 2 [Drosophila subobscura]|uniref:LOW QUALITY PROTEIN: serine/arginine repetitive matrix protein 2 n=1 Tax=Drosophila subobscura TaxID=7241 RepID=UPI00155AD592|nr:LOW QUALITY PROTEIN: serine/arginine repetitive matrix protein 2 [Drosophila subobscura]